MPPPALPPPLPQPAQQRSGCLRACLVTAAVLFGVCVLFAIVGAFISAFQQQTRSQSSGATQPTPVAATQRPTQTSISPAATPSATPNAKDRIAEDTRTVTRIEERVRYNREQLKKYYANKDQIEQAGDDMIQLAALAAIYSSDKAPKEGKGLGQKAKSLGYQVEEQRRELYASTMEQIFIKQGFDAHVTAAGKQKEQLRISYALMSRPLIYQLRNAASLESTARSFGFSKIVFTNGFDSSLGSTWTVDL